MFNKLDPESKQYLYNKIFTSFTFVNYACAFELYDNFKIDASYLFDTNNWIKICDYEKTICDIINFNNYNNQDLELLFCWTIENDIITNCIINNGYTFEKYTILDVIILLNPKQKYIEYCNLISLDIDMSMREKMKNDKIKSLFNNSTFVNNLLDMTTITQEEINEYLY